MKSWMFIAILAAQGTTLAQSQNVVVTGQVIGLDGKPAAGVRVAAAPPNEKGDVSGEQLEKITITDDSGRYRLDDLPPGRYGIMAGAVASPTYYPGTADAAGAKIVTIAPGSTADGLDFKLAISPVAERQALDLSAFVVQAGALTPAGPAIQISGKVIGDGRTLPPDLLNDFKLSFNGYQSMLAGTGTPAPGTAVIFASQLAASNLQTTFVAGTTLRFSSSQAQNGGVTQTIFSSATGGSSVRSDGTFQLSVFPGEYRLAVNRVTPGKARQDDYYLKSVSFESADLLSEMLKVNGPVSGEILITLGVGVQISGNVRNDRGEPESNMEVYFIQSSAPAGQSPTVRSAVTDVQGNFRIRGVPPGDYRFSAEPMLDPSREAPPLSVTVDSPPPVNLILRTGRHLIQ